MNPTIHSYKADDLDTQGYGSLVDCISAEVTEELNGGFTMELKYPLNGQLAEYLNPGAIIVAKPNHIQVKQPFRINQVKRSFNNSISVYANHISYDLSGYSIRAPRTYTSLYNTISAMNSMDWSSDSLVYHDFVFITDMESTATFTMPGIQSLRSWMGGQDGSIIDVYGGEWVYDYFTCYLTARRGRDTGVRISYGKNLSEYEKNRTNTQYSHVCAYWKKSETLAYSDLIATNMACAFRVAYYDASKEFENQPTTSQLNSVASSQIRKMTFDTKTITVTPAQLGNDTIGLGDSVLICYDDVFSTRVIKTVYNVLTEQYSSIQLGSKQASISDTIKSLTTGPSGESGAAADAWDYVIDEGTASGWTYRKWKNGDYECWYRETKSNVAITSASGSGYYAKVTDGLSFPITFVGSYPVVQWTVQCADGYGWIAPAYNYTYSYSGGAYIYSFTSVTKSFTFDIYAKGKWK